MEFTSRSRPRKLWIYSAKKVAVPACVDRLGFGKEPVPAPQHYSAKCSEAAFGELEMLKWIGIWCVAGLIGVSSGASAQEDPADADAAPRVNGVFHGNYCGIGDNGPGLPPTDALDAACMHHDACTPSGGLPTCGCNARFQREIHQVATSPREPEDLRLLARTMEASIPLILCRH
ncbi:hypothetical protein [Lichenifustis flavocetrariae]|uniref:Phospholipase A2 domain-containing protein n=1 Tax=Lichenifustis flavocetrariae TaxID=2949735 RepID=A0AA41YXL2_9HYPH|nr:hypothetical protein [Lichenifustis flavocetrariae]MCW6510431.1 hypothetical protein [Lichenifustis flavocetrariae]